MPVAVPTGNYEIEASVDLSPLFGKIEHFGAVDVVLPSEKILNDRLAQLESEDVNQRRMALIDLRYFREDAEKVVPALVACLDDGEEVIRMVALSVLMAYPEQAAAHVERFYSMLESEDGVSVRGNAAYLISRVAPVSDRAEQALMNALESADENLKSRIESALTTYRRRAGAE